jgi:voltage-gated potassium channel
MILGYGIIAVPTGIVTAEIAKSTQNKIVTDKKPCTGCGTEDYPEIILP